ncbi:MAG: PaaX domain protein [Parcubacteria group bacterium GW2011_GWC2_39_11]|nr:MAG: PaaX domain protein [Parcubacteria group bacterium GW2011_GWA2_38_27]KKQ96669.1 MAG: PaaX domain protein [Parcubacteria group bacterium GW2011_GWC2_39_11]
MAKLILRRLLIGGAVFIAAQSPYFWLKFYKNFFEGRPIFRRKIKDTFSYLRKRGLIIIEKDGKNFYMRLTKKGELIAGKYQIDELYIKKQKKWDKKWRVIIFDIPENRRIKRDLFRSKLKGMGFRQFQKSVWIYPYPCDEEVKLLRGFFGLEEKHLIILTVEKLEGAEKLLKIFNL